jgi:hypothetical protein
MVSTLRPAVSDFPFVSDRIVFQAPASGLLAEFEERAPVAILPSSSAVEIMHVVLTHQDTTVASPLRLDSLAFQFVTPSGNAVYPGDYFSTLFITHAGDTAAIETSLSSISSVVECPLSNPITVAPSSMDSFTVLIDTKGLFSPTQVEIRIERDNLAIYDVNDGSRTSSIIGVFPFVAGPISLQLPSDQVLAGLISRLPANLTTQATGVDVLDLVIENNDPTGHTAVEMRALHIIAQDAKGVTLNPAQLVSGATLVVGDSTLSGIVGPADILFNLPASLVSVQSGASDTLAVRVDLQSSMSNANFRFAITDTSAVDAVDAVTGTPAAVGTINGVGYPLTTNWTHVLGTDMAAAYTNYPNPFAAGRQTTTITYLLTEVSTVSLKLYTLWGAPVRTLVDRMTMGPGLYQDVTWDGKNSDGDTVNNGVYYLLLEIRDVKGVSYEFRRKVGVIR